MGNPLATLKHVFWRILGLIPFSLLEKAEDLIQRQLGKGSGAWSTKKEAQAISRFVKEKSLSEITAIDAGANMGDWSHELLSNFPDAQIFAFEPSKDAYEKLCRRFTNIESINCQNIALGKENKVTKLYSDKSGSGLGSLTKRRVEHFDIDFSYEEVIEVQTLDTWLSNLGFDLIPNILKMDVEGHEFDILLGAGKTIRKLQIIQFEFGGSNIDTRTYFQDFWYFFRENNFDLFRITPGEPILIKEYSEKDECFRATNYLAVRK